MAIKQDEKQTKQNAGAPLSEHDELALLRADNQRLNDRVLELESALGLAEKNSAGFAGYVIRTKVASFSGVTAGVQFRNGIAFLPMVDGAEAKARMLRDDFSYQVEQVTDWRKTQEAATLANRMSEVMA